jgi:negative regulator of flagellin synthesis FlgM
LEHNMKIGPLDPKTAAAPNAGERKQALPATPTAPGAEPSASVDLSASAALRAQGRGEASFDQAKVDRVALAIRDGSYKVNAGTIADKLIANAEELLGRTSR